MFSWTLRGALALSVLAAACAQEPAFDAASVKPASVNPGGWVMIAAPTGGPGSGDPGRIHFPNISLKMLLTTAYDVKMLQVSGPPWLDTERYNVDATMPPDTSRDRFRAMLRNLLAERFRLQVHRETRELPVYALVVAKGGSKMHQSAETPAAPANTAVPPAISSQPKIGPDGFPIDPMAGSGRAGLFGMMMPGRSRLIAHEQTMESLANRLTIQLTRMVKDETGLQGKYDFVLTYSTEGLPGSAAPMGGPPLASVPPSGSAAGASGTANVFVPGGEAPPDLFSAIQSQLGLKLQAKKGPVEIIVVDHAEKVPVGN